MDRRQPPNDEPAPHEENPNVFDDEYAVDGLDFGFGVADGFRPGAAGAQSNSAARDDRGSDAPARRSSSIHQASEINIRHNASRNSTSKGHGTRDSFGILHDGADSPLPARRTSTYNANLHAAGLAHRLSVSSTASFATMARSQSPYTAGPSHPYAMYPQGTGVARSSSVTTSSTTRQPPRPYTSQSPAHPYAMYPQNVVEDPDEGAAAPPQLPVIPVGFPGLGQGYHRRIGPDGEEQDIVGPDGHTEQLPPYSRYPEEGLTKGPLVTSPVLNPVDRPPSIGGTASQDALVGSTNRASTNPNGTSAESQPHSNTELGPSEKSWKEKSWKEKRRTKLFCGTVPLWLVLIIVGLVLIFAVVLGAAIGSILTKEHMSKQHGHPPPASVVYTTVTSPTMFDASLIPTPTNLSPLPTGSFAFFLGTAQEANDACLTLSDEVNAWSCDGTGSPIQLTIGEAPGRGTNGNLAAWLNSPPGSEKGVKYGVQTPEVDMRTMDLVEDQEDPERGPAWHFQANYNKLVVLPVEQFDPHESGVQKRTPQGGFPKPSPRFEVQPGEMAWFCVWNQTFIEGFIYVEENSTTAASSVAAASSSFAYTTGAYTTPTSSSGSLVLTTPEPTVLPTTPFGSLTSSATPSASYSPLPLFPLVIKIEERRLPNSPTPYCQKMLRLQDGFIVPAVNDTGAVIVVDLQEDDPSMSAFLNMGSTKTATAMPTSSSGHKRKLALRDEPANDCHCQWVWS